MFVLFIFSYFVLFLFILFCLFWFFFLFDLFDFAISIDEATGQWINLSKTMHSFDIDGTQIGVETNGYVICR